jgi:hypothetical protein
MPRSGKGAIHLSTFAFLCGVAIIIIWIVYSTKWYNPLLGVVVCAMNIYNIRNIWERWYNRNNALDW